MMNLMTLLAAGFVLGVTSAAASAAPAAPTTVTGTAECAPRLAHTVPPGKHMWTVLSSQDHVCRKPARIAASSCGDAPTTAGFPGRHGGPVIATPSARCVDEAFAAR